ncbi:MAG: hypothetical protein V3U03_17335 [Myxococcota bacterium]
MKIRLVVAWYDCWIGWFWDRRRRRLFLMIPMIGVRLDFKSRDE